MTTPVLEVRDLTVRYEPKLGEPLTAVDGVSFGLGAGEFVGLIGESGCGKTTLGTALLRLLQRPGRVTGGSVLLDGEDLLTMNEEELRRRRWREISTVFQASMNSLNPVTRIEKTFADVMRAHTELDDRAIAARSVELMEMVQIDPAFLRHHPHELSGGMKQRVNLALALALRPRFVLLDEPTTGLDVVVQKTILDNVRALQAEQGFTVLFISHDIGTVLETSDSIMVMYAGRLVEAGRSEALMHRPLHPYTKALLGSYGDPRAETITITYLPGRPFPLGRARQGCAFAERCPEVRPECREIDPPLRPVGPAEVACLVAEGQAGTGPLAEAAGARVEGFAGPAFEKSVAESDSRGGDVVIEVDDVVRTFTRRHGLHRRTTTAVDGVSFTLRDGQVTALVGESGSGKSTLAKLITGALSPSSGAVRYHGGGEGPVSVDRLRGAALRRFRAEVQYVFQDPYAALNPAHPIGYALTRAVRNFQRTDGPAARDTAVALLESVGLSPGRGYLGRFPYQLSGGQRQRVVIARALASRPRLLIADEPIASLDVSIRAEILELLDELVRTRGVGILYITHDLLSARMLADDALVLNHGRVVERGRAVDVITHPTDAYTQRLLAAIPNPAVLAGSR